MPTVTVITDGGGDYTTLAAAISGEAGDLSVTGKLTINCSGTAPDISLPNVAGFTNNSETNCIEINMSGGYELHPTLSANGVGFYIQEPWVFINRLVQRCQGEVDPGGQTHGIRMTAAATNCKINGFILEGQNPAHGGSQYGLRDQGSNNLFQNGLIYGWESSVNTCYSLVQGTNSTAVNCTVIGSDLATASKGIAGGASINCYSGGFAFDYENTVLTNCASSDATGSAGLQNIALDNTTFLNVAANDYTLAAGSPLIAAGVGPELNNNVPNDDFEADPRTGNVTDIGFDQLVDIAAPAFNSGPAAANVGARQMDVNSEINENGTIAVVVLTGAAQPQPNDATFDGVEVTVSANTPNSQTKTGLVSVTTYTVWVRAADFYDNYTYSSFEQATTTITPVITSVSTLRAGETATITGVDFNATQGAGSVKYNGVTCAIVSWSDTSIDFTVPNNNLQHKNTYDLVVTHDNTNTDTESAVAWLPPTGYSYAVAPSSPYQSTSVWSSIIGAGINDEFVFETVAELSGNPGITANLSIDTDGNVTANSVTQTGNYVFDYYLIDATDSAKSTNGTAIVTLISGNAGDTVPDQFDLGASIVNAETNIDIDISGTITGMDAGVDATVTLTNATISVNGGGFTAGPTTIQNGQGYIFRIRTSASENATTNHSLTIGGVSDSISVTTGAVVASWLGLIPDQTHAPGAAIAPFDVSTYVSNPNSAAFSAAGLPTGLTINTTTGVISGTPTVNQSVTPVITVEGVESNAFSWVISGGVFVTTIPDQNLNVGDAVNINLDDYFQNPELETYSIDDLPEGVTLSANLLTGTVTTAELDTTIVSLGNAASNAFNWDINAYPVFTGTIPDQEHSTDIAASVAFASYFSDPEADTLTYSASGLPTGLTINTNTGVVSGTPSAAGTFNVTITTDDGAAQTASNQFSWVINETLPIGTITTPAQRTIKIDARRQLTQQAFILYPNDKIDYAVDWSAWLRTGEIITAASFTADDLTFSSLLTDQTAMQAWATGGVAGKNYRVTHTITTDLGAKATVYFYLCFVKVG